VRRFLCIGPDVFIGPAGVDNVGSAKLVTSGQIAVLDDNDSRINDFLRWTNQFQEVDENGDPISSPPPVVTPAPDPAPVSSPEQDSVEAELPTQESVTDDMAKTKRRAKPDAESEVSG
jgi:hypothetical protein